MSIQTSDITDNINVDDNDSAAEQLLFVSLDDAPVAPSPEHQLLMGFHFTDEPCPPLHDAMVNLQLKPLDRESQVESWWYKGDVSYSSSGNTRVAECADYAVVIVEMDPVNSEGMRAQAHDAYRELIQAVRSSGHSQMVKIWNYFGEINQGKDDTEKYRQFSIGRAEVFEEMGVNDEEAPTGTAIGTKDGSGLKLIALCTSHSFCPVENPRQVSAFHYPKIYGPSSPKFSRGGFVSLDKYRLVLISGTAAVVGHESFSPYDTALQTDETFKNLDYLCEAISDIDQQNERFALDHNSVLRVYLRDPNDFQAAARKMEQAFGSSAKDIAYLHGIICRRELMIEIDGVQIT